MIVDPGTDVVCKLCIRDRNKEEKQETETRVRTKRKKQESGTRLRNQRQELERHQEGKKIESRMKERHNPRENDPVVPS